MGVLSRNVETPLFDIRLNGTDHDVLLLKGSPTEASSVLLSGKIVFSTIEPLHAKKITLKLVGDLRLNWIDHLQTATSTYSKPQRFVKRIYEHTWENFNMHSYKDDSFVRSKSTTSLRKLGSSSSASDLVAYHDAHNYLLPPGNYEFPFSAILNGDTIESVEGLPGGSVVYKLEATIDRGKFQKRKTCTKHVRIVRTLTPDAPELVETMSIDNVWPNKIEYTISIPCRAVAIGSFIPVNFLMGPLLKGLKLGKITIQLVESYSFASGNARTTHTNERIILKEVIAKPDDSLYETGEKVILPAISHNGQIVDSSESATGSMSVSYDRWEVEKYVYLPASLSKCTQDVTVDQHLKVRHKLSITVVLKNPNGHTSELRATLPLIIYISPFISVSARYSDMEVIKSYSDSLMPKEPTAGEAQESAASGSGPKNVAKTGSIPNSPTASSLSVNSSENAKESEEILFEADASIDASGRPDLIAPPNYGEHIYDKLWSEIETPITPMSGARTPIAMTPTGLQSHGSAENFSNQLQQHLAELHRQQQLQEAQSTTGFTVGSTSNSMEASPITTPVAGTTPVGDYFSIPMNHSASARAPATPDVIYSHLSRANSALHSPATEFSWDAGSLSQVPSYETAVKSNDAGFLSPRYDTSSGSISTSALSGSMAAGAAIPTKLNKRPTLQKRSSSLLPIRFKKGVTSIALSPASGSASASASVTKDSGKDDSDEEGLFMKVKKH